MARRQYTVIPFTEYPVSEGNFGGDGSRQPITTIILHSTAGTYDSAIKWFNNPAAKVSAHYIIANDGRLAAMLEEYNVAFHSGQYAVNQKSIGIECEGYAGMVRTDKQYQIAGQLVADICNFYNIPCNRTFIKPHKEIVATACPTDLDVDRVIREAQGVLAPSQPSVDLCLQVKKDLDIANKQIVNLNIVIDRVETKVSDLQATLKKINDLSK